MKHYLHRPGILLLSSHVPCHKALEELDTFVHAIVEPFLALMYPEHWRLIRKGARISTLLRPEDSMLKFVCTRSEFPPFTSMTTCPDNLAFTRSSWMLTSALLRMAALPLMTAPNSTEFSAHLFGPSNTTVASPSMLVPMSSSFKAAS